jgi:hypothetical protein
MAREAGPDSAIQGAMHSFVSCGSCRTDEGLVGEAMEEEEEEEAEEAEEEEEWKGRGQDTIQQEVRLS